MKVSRFLLYQHFNRNL